MSDVIVVDPEVTRTLDDYDFLFSAGMSVPVTLDYKAGDTYEDAEGFITIRIAAQQSLSDSAKLLPPQDLKINKSHLAYIRHQTREVLQLTPEQRFEWEKALHGRVQ